MRSTTVRLESLLWKERNIREQLIEFRFPHHGGICENVVWRDQTPSTIDQPPSFKVGKANSVSIEHAETDVSLFG